MKLALRHCEDMGDWYVIERHEEPGEHREWMERTEYGRRFMTSSRLSDADVEGSAVEMLDLADSIETRRNTSHKRCAVEFRDGSAYFRSPRNTNEEPVPVPLADADALAALIRGRLGVPA